MSLDADDGNFLSCSELILHSYFVWHMFECCLLLCLFIFYFCFCFFEVAGKLRCLQFGVCVCACLRERNEICCIIVLIKQLTICIPFIHTCFVLHARNAPCPRMAESGRTSSLCVWSLSVARVITSCLKQNCRGFSSPLSGNEVEIHHYCT